MIEKFSPTAYKLSNANGTESGKLKRIVIGSTKLSNCAARIIYMKISDNSNAMP